MNDREFDALLESAAPELPPDDVARDVTPWRRAIGNILGGSALCSITLNFFCLNYLLPTIGVILQLLGFRPLRRENRWFRACWLLAVLRAALFLPCIVLNATIYSNAVYASSVGTALTYAMLAVQMLLFFCFWQALRTMQKKAGTGGGAAPAAALLIWYAAVLALAYVQYSGQRLGLAMLGCYILILRSLFRLSREMEESGYALTPAPVRLSDEMLVRAIAALLAVGIACGYLFFGSYRMDWQPKSDSLSAEAVEIRAQLLALGYPEDALNDLSEDDLLAALGYGGITLRSVMTKLIELYKKDLKEATPPDVSKMLSELKTPQHSSKRNRSSHGVLVEGESGLLVRLARCCNPIPGDPITGFVTKGRGVSVHRSDCPNVLRDNDLSRMIEVSWDIGLDKDYTVEIEIVCNDKSGVLAELLAVPSEMKINIHSVNANPNRSNKTSTVVMGLDVKNATQVAQIMTKMRRLKNVYSVSRALSSHPGQ